ncbi:MAG: hypothetical protein V4638_03475 [Bacteroidota bacterium]
MHHLKKRTALIVLVLLQSTLHAQIAPKYSNEFLNIGVGADALGMGNAFSAQSAGVMAAYWNPAGLTNTNKWLDVGLMHAEYFAGISKYDYIGVAHQIDKKSAFAVSAIRFAVDDIPNTTQLIDNNGNINYDNITTFTAADYGFLFSYARKLKVPGLSLGGNVKIIYRKVGDFAKSWGFGLDGGVLYEMKNAKFGAVLRDATSTFNAWIFNLDDEMKEVFLATGNEIPENGLELTLPRLILSAYKKIPFGEKGIYGAGEIDFDITTDGKRNTLIKSNFASIDPHFGIEFGFKSFVAIRAGLSNMQNITNLDDSKSFNVQPSIGVGLAIKALKIDYAFTDIGDASVALYSHVISLRLMLNPPKKVGP